MLRHVGETAGADRLEGAVVEVLRDGTHVTADLRATEDDRPAVGTAEMTDAVIARL
jgi:isocitrate/isopropylmalate dehydrogenase